MECRPGARVCICWIHVPGACREGDHGSQWTGQHARAPSNPLILQQICLQSSHTSICGCSGDGVLLGGCLV